MASSLASSPAPARRPRGPTPTASLNPHEPPSARLAASPNCFPPRHARGRGRNAFGASGEVTPFMARGDLPRTCASRPVSTTRKCFPGKCPGGSMESIFRAGDLVPSSLPAPHPQGRETRLGPRVAVFLSRLDERIGAVRVLFDTHRKEPARHRFHRSDSTASRLSADSRDDCRRSRIPPWHELP
jgi:hypothetical protein